MNLIAIGIAMHPPLLSRLYFTTTLVMNRWTIKNLALFTVFEILHGFGAVYKQSSDCFALCEHCALCAGIDFLLKSALPDFAHTLAVWSFYSNFTAAHTIYHFCRDWSVVHFAPKLGSLLAQIVIIVESSNICIAFFTIKPTVSNIIFYFDSSFILIAEDMIM